MAFDRDEGEETVERGEKIRRAISSLGIWLDKRSLFYKKEKGTR